MHHNESVVAEKVVEVNLCVGCTRLPTRDGDQFYGPTRYHCVNCGFSTERYDDAFQAAEAWNRLSPRPNPCAICDVRPEIKREDVVLGALPQWHFRCAGCTARVNSPSRTAAMEAWNDLNPLQADAHGCFDCGERPRLQWFRDDNVYTWVCSNGYSAGESKETPLAALKLWNQWNPDKPDTAAMEACPECGKVPSIERERRAWGGTFFRFHCCNPHDVGNWHSDINEAAASWPRVRFTGTEVDSARASILDARDNLLLERQKQELIDDTQDFEIAIRREERERVAPVMGALSAWQKHWSRAAQGKEYGPVSVREFSDLCFNLFDRYWEYRRSGEANGLTLSEGEAFSIAPQALSRAVIGAIKSCVNDHGPITPESYGSLSKRIVGSIKSGLKETATKRSIRETQRNRTFRALTGEVTALKAVVAAVSRYESIIAVGGDRSQSIPAKLGILNAFRSWRRGPYGTEPSDLYETIAPLPWIPVSWNMPHEGENVLAWGTGPNGWSGVIGMRRWDQGQKRWSIPVENIELCVVSVHPGAGSRKDPAFTITHFMRIGAPENDDRFHY